MSFSLTTVVPLSTAQIFSTVSSLIVPPNHNNIPYIEHSLRELKIHGRSQATSANITTHITSTLIRAFVLRPPSETAKVEALTIIANALVLNSELLDSFDPNQYSLVNIILSDYNDTHNETNLYLYGRLLFLFTFKGFPLNLKHDCFQIIHAKLTGDIRSAPVSATIELLKFIFNLLHHPRYMTFLHSIELKSQIFTSLLALLDSDSSINKDLFNVLSLFSSSYWSTSVPNMASYEADYDVSSNSSKTFPTFSALSSNILISHFDSILSFISNQNSSIFIDLTPALTCLYNLTASIPRQYHHLLMSRLNDTTLKTHLIFEASLSQETSNLVYDIYALLLNNDTDLLTVTLGVSFTSQRQCASRKNSEFSIFEDDYIFSRRHSTATAYTGELTTVSGLSEREKEEEVEKLFRVFERLNMFTDM